MRRELKALLEAEEEQEEAPPGPGDCRTVAKNGVWQVPPAQRPPGWREMGLKEPKVQRQGRTGGGR